MQHFFQIFFFFAHFNAFAYNFFAMSVLCLLGQLDSPPKVALDAEMRALRVSAPGPGNWCLPSDLWRLQQHFGMPMSFRSLSVVSHASKLRVAVLEAVDHHEVRSRMLRDLLLSTDFPERRSQWKSACCREHG